jgi:hypothetical protein
LENIKRGCRVSATECKQTAELYSLHGPVTDLILYSVYTDKKENNFSNM